MPGSEQSRQAGRGFWPCIRTMLGALLLLPCLVSAQDKPSTKTTKRPVNKSRVKGAQRLAEPTGPYLVGTRTWHWVDEKRAEVLTPEKNDKRELMVQVWYPVSKRAKGKPLPKDWASPYVPGFETLEPLLEAQYGRSAGRFGHLQVPAKTGAGLIRSPRKLPLVLFSHGLRTARFYYTSQALELASQGYVVLCPDHSYDVEGVAFPEQRLLRGIFDDEERQRAIPPAYRSQDGRIRLWASDLVFLLDRMLGSRKPKPAGKSFPFRGRVDQKRIAVIGHCFGGQAALEIGMLDKRVRVIIAQNAWPPSSAVRKQGLQKPILMLYAETDTAEEGLLAQGVPKSQIQALKKAYLAEQRKGLQALTHHGLQVRIHGARHMSFSDEFLIRSWLDLPDGQSPPPPDQHLRRALVYTVAFLDRELRRKKPKLLEKSTSEREGVDFEDLSTSTKRRRTRARK